MTIGEVAKKTGLRASAIRFYEKSGLLPDPIRTAGQRRYSRAILERLAVLQRAKDCGMTLAEAKQLINGEGPPAERWGNIARSKLAELDALAQRVERSKTLLRRRCECADLGERGRAILGQDYNSV